MHPIPINKRLQVNYTQSILFNQFIKFKSKGFLYIESNYESEIKLSYVDKLGEMSKGYFCTCFRQMTGKIFTDYVNLFRIEKAAVMLKQNKSSITDIALSVGFEDMSYFCRIFKKYMGQSPSSYRRSA